MRQENAVICDVLYLIIEYIVKNMRDHIEKILRIRHSSGDRGTWKTRRDYRARSKQPVNSVARCMIMMPCSKRVHRVVAKVTTPKLR